MGWAKEMWFAEVERLVGVYEDEGMDPADAYDKACEQAQHSAFDRLYDAADALRKRMKEDGR